MARDGAGNMSIPYPDFVSGTVIDDSQVDANNTTIVAEITNSIARDGQSAATADIPLGGNKITGLKAGSAATDSATLSQVQANAYIWGNVAGGTNNALTISASPAITAYAAGQVFRFIAGVAASDDAVTINVNSVGAKAIQNNGAALSAAICIEAGKLYEIIYDGTQFQINKVETVKGTYAPLAGATLSGTTTVSSTLNLSSLTASQLLATDASKNVVNVTALPNGTTATTQTAADNSTKAATTAYADRAATNAVSASITEWADYTPTITHTSGGATNYTATGQYRVVGDTLEANGSIVFSNASSAFADVFVSIPAAYVVDTAKMNGTTAFTHVGNGTYIDAGAVFFLVQANYKSTTTIGLYIYNGTGTYVYSTSISNTVPMTVANGDTLYWSFKVPVAAA